MRRRIALVAAGIVLLVVAGVVRFVVVPQALRLPADYHGTSQATGTYSGVNPDVLTGTDGDLFLDDVPLALTSDVRVRPAGDGDAFTTLTTTTKATGFRLPRKTFRYLVDRSSFAAVAPGASSGGVTRADGQVFSLPPHPSPKAGYRLWDQFTGRSFPLTHTGDGRMGGRPVQVWTSTAQGPVGDPAAFGFPAALSHDQAARLAPVLAASMPASIRDNVPTLLGLLPGRIPLQYTARTRTTFYADAELGVPISASVQQSVDAKVEGPAGLGATLSTVSITSKPESVAEVAHLAGTAARMLRWAGTVAPAVVGGLGVVLLVVGLLRRRPSGSAVGTEPGTVLSHR